MGMAKGTLENLDKTAEASDDKDTVARMVDVDF